MNQALTNGMTEKMLLTAGHQSSQCGISPGTYVDNGEKRYRWAKISDASASVGMVALRFNTAATDHFVLSAGKHLKSAYVDGQGGATNDREIYLYGCSALTNTIPFEGGQFVVYSGVGGGYSYRVNRIEAGYTGCLITKVYLEEPIVVGLSTTTYARLQSNPYYGLVRTAWTYTGKVMGVFTDDVTASGWQLIQTKGIAMVLTSGIVSAGRQIVPCAVLSGRVRRLSTTTAQSAQVIGRAMMAGYSAYCQAFIDVDID